jgi:hypothetical protein
MISFNCYTCELGFILLVSSIVSVGVGAGKRRDSVTVIGETGCCRYLAISHSSYLATVSSPCLSLCYTVMYSRYCTGYH